MQFDCTLIQLKKRIISYFFADVVNTVLYLVRLHQLNLVTVPEQHVLFSDNTYYNIGPIKFAFCKINH
jgi:hypothetical protein